MVSQDKASLTLHVSFFPNFKKSSTLYRYHISTYNINTWKGCHRMTRLQPREKKKSKKKLNDSSQRGHNIYKWNFHNFQTPEFCSTLKKNKSYPFEHWETVWSLLCQFKKIIWIKSSGQKFWQNWSNKLSTFEK